MTFASSREKGLFIETLISTQRRQGAKEFFHIFSLRLGAFALKASLQSAR
jgi:hypothetical protein